MEFEDLIKCFDTIKIYKYKNSDPIRDVDFAIMRNTGKTFKSLSSVDVSAWQVRTRIDKVLRNVRSSIYRMYRDQDDKIYDLIYNPENREKLLTILNLYKDYLQSKLDSNNLYKPFKKDIIKIKKRIINKNKCAICDGTGYIYLEGNNNDT